MSRRHKHIVLRQIQLSFKVVLYSLEQGIPVDEQRLMHKSAELEDGKTLAFYGITSESELHLVLRLPSTPQEKASGAEKVKISQQVRDKF